MSKIAAYRASMLARKAATLGVTVAELLAASAREADITRRANELRYARRTGFPSIAGHAAQRGRTWVVL
jgi:hypothetical protein